MKVIYEPKGKAREYSPLAVNLYTGCEHGCDYCYVFSSLAMSRANPDVIKPRDGILEKLEKDCISKQDKSKPVLLCFTCDPYQPCSELYGTTRAALQILRRNNIPFRVLTKGGLRATKDFDLYSDKDEYGVTLTLMDEALSRKHEPKAATPKDRIESLKIAHDKGIATWVSIEPVLDPKQSEMLIENTLDFVDIYKVGKLNHYNIKVDWNSFGASVIRTLVKHGKRYYIKEDLRRHIKDRYNFDTTAGYVCKTNLTKPNIWNQNGTIRQTN